MSVDDSALAVEVLRTSRRRLLCGALGATAAAVLTACSAPVGNPSGASASRDPDAPVARVSDVPVGGGVVAGDLVVVRPEEDLVKAFSSACPHQRSPVEAPVDGVITCPSHKSKFSAVDGALLDGPATTGLTAVAVKITDGEIFLA